MVDDLLENPEDLKTQPSSEQNCVASNLLLIVEHVLRKLSTALSNESLTFHTAGGTGKCPHLSLGSAFAFPHPIPPPFLLDLVYYACILVLFTQTN